MRSPHSHSQASLREFMKSNNMKESDKPESRSLIRRSAAVAIPSIVVIAAVLILFLMNAPNSKLLSNLNGTVSAQAAIDQPSVEIHKGSIVKTLVINGDL